MTRFGKGIASQRLTGVSCTNLNLQTTFKTFLHKDREVVLLGKIIAHHIIHYYYFRYLKYERSKGKVVPTLN
jgi:hypothetical protein